LIFDHKWYFGDSTQISDINPVKTYANSGNFTVKLVETSFYGCSDSVTKTITVNPNPTVTIATPNGTILCDGLTLPLVGAGGASYLWYKGESLLDTAKSATYLSNTLGNYSVKSVSSFGCVSLSDAKVTTTVLTKPRADFNYNTYCTQFPVTYTNLTNSSNSGAVTYVWKDNLSNTSAINSPAFTYNSAGSVNMKLSVTSTYCPNLVDSITKTLTIQSPIAGVRLPLVDAVIGDDTRLQAREIPGMKYSWSSPELLSNATISNPTARISAQQEFKILMTSMAGCQTTDSLLVRAFKEFTVFVPKAFSPNGDGINDKLIPNFIGLKEFKFFRIYNRAGQIVFESSNAGDGWDGNVNGNPQPLDTYMWVVEAISKYGAPIRETGLVTLLR
jgi:hypothetical protein